MIAGTVFVIAGAIWMLSAYWMGKSGCPKLMATSIAVGALNIAAGSMIYAAA